jgi:hypothetical protein
MPCLKTCFTPLLVALLAALSSPPAAKAQFEQLLTKIPSSANAVVLLDAERLFASPLGVREGWKDKYEQSFASGLVTMSPDTQRLVLATQLDYEFMKPQWEVAVADFGKGRSAAEVARSAKGILEKIGDVPVVALRDNTYAVELGPKRLGAMSPANRQAVARWLRETQGQPQPLVSSYLKGTLAAKEQSAIVVAFDLEDAIPPDIIRAKLAASSSLKGKNIDLDAAAKVLEGIRGLVLEVSVNDGSFGRLMVHFRSDASLLVPVAKPLLQEILADLGATIDDLEGWKMQAEPQRISFNGTLSAAGRKRIFSLIDNPLASIIATEQTAPTAEDRKQTQLAAASQQYFKSLTSILSEVKEKSGDAKTFGENALWFDKWARRIDKLPLLNVDKDLLGFGQYVSTQLRNMASSMRGIGINSGARTAQVYQQVSTDYNAYAGYGGGGYSYYTEWRNVDGERRAIRAEERATGATSARGIAAEIANATAKVRQDMTQKYQVEF